MAMRKVVTFVNSEGTRYFVSKSMYESFVKNASEAEPNGTPPFLTFSINCNDEYTLEGRTPLRGFVQKLLDSYPYPDQLVGRWETLLTREVVETEEKITYTIKGRVPDEELLPEEEVEEQLGKINISGKTRLELIDDEEDET